ncbi:MAG TPA: alkyl hydroperoxide reductase subunit F [Acidimicrobiales bacterium]|nr:alkyl hydroperoxide reductase subunit F [Acidimicrobiales bacterium]
MLDPAIAAQLRTHFATITRDVELVASLDDSPKAAEMAALLDELAACSPRVTVRRDGADQRRPSFAVASAATGEAVRFAAIPMGHEFTSLVLAVLQVGGRPSTAPGELLERVVALPGEHVVETYVSLSCQNCPDVVQAFNVIAVTNPAFRHVTIDGALHREEAEARQVLAVPTVFVDGVPFGSGRMTLAEIVDRLDAAGAGDRAAALSAREPYDMLVVGAGPAGAAAAVYAARKGIRTGVVADRVGGQVLDTAGIENLISIQATDGPRLAADLEAHVRAHEVDMVTAQRAARLVPAAEPGGLATVELEGGAQLRARSVVVATGARWRRLGVDGEERLLTKGVTYCPHCDGPLFKAKRVAVVGGGNSGVEAAIDLAGIAAHVTLLEYEPVLKADDVLQRKLRSLANVSVVCAARVTEVVGAETVTGLRYDDRDTAASHVIDVAGVFVQIGLLPNTDWLGGTVERTPHGEVVVDARGATSVPGVFAAGDCTTVPFKQIVVALGAGSIAALSAFDHLVRTSAPDESPALLSA